MAARPLLFTPVELRGVKLRNRFVISLVCNYPAIDDHINDLHLVHLGKFAQGGAGMVFTGAAAVDEHRRITHGTSVCDLTGTYSALHNPNRPLYAEAQLGRQGHFESWPVQYGWWLNQRHQAMSRQETEQAAA